MDKNNRITIEAVGNGFIVTPTAEEHMCVATKSIRVFQRLAHPGGSQTLVDFIKEHFDPPQEELWEATDPKLIAPGPMIDVKDAMQAIPVVMFEKEPAPKPKA